MDSPIRRLRGPLAAVAALLCTLGIAGTARAATTYNVTAGDASSLADAINQANGDGDDSIVNVPAGTYAVGGNGLPAIAADGSFTLIGAGARSTIIDNTPSGDGDGSSTFEISSNAVAAISGVTLTGSSVDGSGGAIFIDGASLKGSLGSLTLTDSTLSDNAAFFGGDDGGGIFDAGILTVNGSDHDDPQVVLGLQGREAASQDGAALHRLTAVS